MIFRNKKCGEIRTDNIGEKVILSGWVQRRRDHGKVIFIDLRDRSGLVQVVFDYEQSKEIFALAEELRSEYVVRVEGKVVARDKEAVNPKLATGEIEIHAESLDI